MNQWFEHFASSLAGAEISSDLVGAGSALPQKALEHYRYQHETKIREAVESTFMKLVKSSGAQWAQTWKSFRETHPASPRSLDWYPQLFLDYYLSSQAPHHLKELARFEQAMDVHPWTHRCPAPVSLEGMTADSRLVIAPLDLHYFAAPVSELYQEEDGIDLTAAQNILLWMKDDGVHFRVMQEWELRVLENVLLGINEALEHAPQEPEAVGRFFKWLGESCLIRQVLGPGTNF